jgi:glycosyltransferase involved in cell wall biosynthesis
MDPGGVETWLLHLLENIDRDRFQFDFCLCGLDRGLHAEEVGRLGGRIFLCSKGANLYSFRDRFRKILRQGNYDVVHSHVHFFSGVLLRWAQAEHIPVRIAHSHTSQDGRANTQLRSCYRSIMKSWIDRYATHGLAASKLAATELFGKNWRLDSRFKILDYGLDLNAFRESFDPREVRAEFNIPTRAPVAGHVGRFDGAKNHRFLLEVAGAVKKSRPDIHFLLVGDGPLRSEIEKQARAMNLSDTTHFIGTRTDVPRLMLGAMDLFIFPSVYEGLGICLLEAQVAGLPCLVSDAVPREVARVPEAVDFLALSAGKDCWAAKIIRGLNTRQKESASVLNAAAQSKFSMQRSLLHLADLYSTGQGSQSRFIAEQHV